LTIFDATDLQRCLAELCDYPAGDRVDGFDYLDDSHSEKPTYLSDLNRNGVYDIGDVTQLQRILLA